MKTKIGRFFHKAGQILFCLIPILATLGIQIAVTIPVTFYYFSALGIAGISPAKGQGILDWIYDMLFQSDYVVYVTVVWGIISMVVFLLWYLHIHDRSKDIPVRKTLTTYGFSGLLLMMVGLQIGIQYLYSLAETYFPQLFESYNQLMDMEQYGTIGYIIMLLYGIFVAPIHEELLNRGVTLHYAAKALPFWAANLLQATLFGLLHMNLVQGSYAFIVGLVLGYIYKTSGNLKVAVLFHMLFNLFGSLISLMPLSTDEPSAYVLVGVLGAIIALSGWMLFQTATRMRDEKQC
ncbi:MAG: lysostaphin resistance A-like protein [Lachnospiraceae bacterium]